jgi:outer membrane protein assembly factor BamB
MTSEVRKMRTVLWGERGVVWVLSLLCVAYGSVSQAADWPQWRGNRQHTGYQPTPGTISKPVARPLAHLGTTVSTPQVLLGKLPTCDHVVYLASPGVLRARCSDGRSLWSTQIHDATSPRALMDFDGDGRLDLLTASSGFSLSHIEVLDAGSGRLIWTSPSVEGAVGALALHDLDGDSIPDIAWAPAGSSTVMAYRLAKGARLLWKRELDDYQSDPYSFTPMVVSDLDHDGVEELILAGGRHQFSVIVLRASDGHLLEHEQFFNEDIDARTIEGGGDLQFLAASDVDGDGDEEIVVVGGYSSSAQYMFQGVMVASSDLSNVEVATTAPPSFVSGSLIDLDGDGLDEFLASHYDPARRRHEIRVTDLRSLTTRVTLDDLQLVSIVDGDGTPIVLTHPGVRAEEIAPVGPVRALRFEAGRGFSTAWEQSYVQLLPDTSPAALARSDIANPGGRTMTRDADRDGKREVIAVLMERGQSVITSLSVDSGKIVAQLPVATGDGVSFAQSAWGSPEGDMVVGLRSGALLIVDSSLKVVGSFDAGGYYLHDAGNGHSFETAIITDLDADGKNEIYASGPQPMVYKIDAAHAAPAVEEFIRPNAGQDLVAIQARGKRALLMRACYPSDFSSLCAVDSSAKILWYNELHDEVGSRLPLGPNLVYGIGTTAKIVVAGGESYPMTTRLLDSEDGRDIWSTDVGPYWDATYAVMDVDHDNIDDIAFNFSQNKAGVLAGRDGNIVSAPGTPPEFNDLKIVDYNGALMAGDFEENGGSTFIAGQDNAHLSMWRPTINQTPAELMWAAPFRALDDERDSMPAVAPTPAGFVVGSGSRRGILTARSARDGSILWSAMPRNGTLTQSNDANRLSSVLALDVDGNGTTEFVVGGYDGWLYAIDALTGRLVWSISLGAAVGDPIAGDVDGDGGSEIIVSVADGNLYEVQDIAPDRRRAVGR